MSSSSCAGPVPSKNALRALRRLAFGTPGLVVGTVGSVCALAGVQYEIWRKVRLAQDIVDTKRTLASFSNGRGKDRVRQMLEAAENGDDFLMDRRRLGGSQRRQRQRQRQRRDHSTTTATLVHVHDDTDDAVLMLRAASSLDVTSSGNVRRRSSSYEPAVLVEHGQPPPPPPSAPPHKQQEPKMRRVTLSQPFPNHASHHILQSYRGDACAETPSSTTEQQPSDERAHQSSISRRSWKRLYARDFENSSAERIRLATIQSMKPANHSVYSRRPRAPADQSPVPACLDLAPRHDDTENASGEREYRPTGDTVVSADKAGSTTSQWPVLNSAEAELVPAEASISEIFTSSFFAVEQEQVSNEAVAACRVLPGKFAAPSESLHFAPAPEENMDREQYLRWLGTYRLEADGFRGWMKALRSLRVLQANTASIERKLLAMTRMRGTSNDGIKENLQVSDVSDDQGQEQSAVPRSYPSKPFVVPPPLPDLPVLALLPHGLAGLDYDRYASMCTEIGYCPSRLKREFALSSKIEDLVSAGSPADLQLAELLFHTLFKPLQGSSPLRRIPLPVIRLAARLLDGGHSQRAAGLIFPYDDQDLVVFTDSSRYTRARTLYGSAHDFLAWHGRNTLDPNMLEQVTRQTLEAATIRGIKLANLPIGYLLAPVLRSLCSRGHVERAHTLLKNIQDQYGIALADTLDARATLMVGYANSNRIVPLKMMLDECHANGVSRHYPRWYSRAFQEAFQRHLRSNPLSESYDLLVHAMAYWGLMPTETVSAVFLSECLRYERYDFIREYVQAVRELYSFIDLGTGTSLLAWRFGRVWREMQASCQQILKGCQALAYCATDDPFGRRLRDVVEEASRLNITKCLSALLLVSGRSSNVDQLLKLSFPEIIEWAQNLVSDPDVQSPAFLDARQRLLTQLGALSNLNRLLGGHGPVEQPENSSHRHATGVRRPISTLPDGEDDGGYSLRIFQTPNVLPDQDTLWRYLAMHYAHRQRKGLSTNHNLLCHVCQELIRLQRSVEAAELFAAVHESPYGSETQGGTPFDENVLQAWFDAATSLDSPLAATKVMWAIIDADEKVFVSTPLLLQAEHACRRVLDNFIAKRQARNPSAFQQETLYLQQALRRRYERQAGLKSHEERLMWSKYKSWDESTIDVVEDEDLEELDFGSGNGHNIDPMPVHAF